MDEKSKSKFRMDIENLERAFCDLLCGNHFDCDSELWRDLNRASLRMNELYKMEERQKKGQ